MKKKHLIKLALILCAVTASFLVVTIAKAPKGLFIETKKEQVKTYTPVVLPSAKTIFVPYTVQAPFANWKVHEESCEEAAILMYDHFLDADKTENLDPTAVDSELRAIVAWQVKNWGAERDLPLGEVGRLAQGYYGDQYQISEATENKIKEQISLGHPVLVPVMTKSLKNPHYSPGNVYHILLIKGYDETGVVTNDAGVKEGKDWHYTWDILWGAIDAQKVTAGRQMLTMTK